MIMFKMEESELHTDFEIPVNIYYGEKTIGRHDAFPDIEYRVLKPGEAERMILQGRPLRHLVIPSLTTDGFIEACRNSNLADEDAISNESFTQIDGNITIHQPITARSCIFGAIDLRDLNIVPTQGDIAINIGISLPTRDEDKERNCFLGDIHFGNCKFSGHVYLHDCSFNRDVTFWESHFNLGLNVAGSIFRNNLQLGASTIKGSLHLFGIIVLKDCTLRGIEVHGGLCADESIVMNRLICESIEVDSSCSLDRMTGGYLELFNSTFRGILKVKDASLDGFAIENCIIHECFACDCYATDARAEEILLAFSCSTISDLGNSPNSNLNQRNAIHRLLRHSSVYPVIKENLGKLIERHNQRLNPICRFSLSNVILLGDLQFPFNLLAGNAKHPVLAAHMDNKWEAARRQYRWLKEQYSKGGYYDDADSAHWFAQECQKRSKGFVGRMLDGIIMKGILGYGVRPWRVFGNLVLAIAIFAALYFAIDCTVGMNYNKAGLVSRHIDSIIYSVYFSAVTFLTIGYGDIVPNGWVTLLTVLEGLVGVFMTSSFIVVLFRKIAR
jgi:hypothetical protein